MATRVLLTVILCLAACVILSGCERTGSRPGQSESADINIGESQASRSSRRSPSGSQNRTHRNNVVAGMARTDSGSAEARLLLTGRVTLKGRGPVSSATVQLIRPGITPASWHVRSTVQCAVTGTDGDYSIAADDSPCYLLRASFPGAASHTDDIEDRAALESGVGQSGTRRIEHHFELVPSARIAGRVQTEAGEPVPGVTIKAVSYQARFNPQLGTNEAQTTSSVSGSFVMDEMPAGKVSVFIDDDRYVPLSDTVTAPSDNILLKLSRVGGSVDGNVFLHSTGEGTQGATVTLALLAEDWRARDQFVKKEVVSGAGGFFRFDRLPAGKHRLSVSKPGLLQLPSDDPRGDTVLLADGESTGGIALYLYQGHTVKGRVTEKGTNVPVAGAKVMLGYPRTMSAELQEKLTCLTGADGSYRIARVNGSAPVRAEKKGYVTVQDASPSGQQMLVQFTRTNLEVYRDILMTRAVAISGTVMTEERQPIAGAAISLQKRYGYVPKEPSLVFSDANGAYEIETAPFAPICVAASLPGFPVARSEEVTVADKPVQNINIAIRSGGTITGRVLDLADNPVECATVYANASISENHRNTQSGQGGVFVLEGVAPEETRLAAMKQGFGPSEDLKLSVKPGRTEEATLHLRAAHFLAGRITNEAGGPVSGANASACPSAGGAGVTGTSDSTGAYRIDDLPEGSYTVVVYHRDYAQGRSDKVQVDRNNVDFTLKDKKSHEDATDKKPSKASARGVLTGRIVERSSGQPLVEARVALKGAFSFAWDAARAQPLKVVTTGAEGRFRFEELSAGSNFIAIRLPRTGADAYRGFDVADAKETDVGDIVLGTACAIRGMVVRGAGDEPVAASRVVLKDSIGGILQETQTDGSGAFEFAGLANASFTVSVSGSKLSWEANLSEKDEVEITLRLGGVTLKGIIMRGGKPEKSLITLARSSASASIRTETSEDGRFEVRDLSPGRWSCDIHSRAGVLPSYIGYSLDVTEGMTEHTIHLPAGRISGRAEDGTGKAVSGVQVSLTQAHDASSGGYMPRFIGKPLPTESDGSFVFEGLEQGSYAVSVKAAAGSAMADIRVQKDTAAPPLVLKLTRQGGTLISTALSLSTGKPLTEVWCSLRTANGEFKHEAKRGPDGRMKITDIPPGMYEVEVGSYACSISRHSVKIESGKTETLEDVLYDAGAFFWTIRDSERIRLPNVPCRLVPGDPNSIEKERTGSTGWNGTWTVLGLSPGKYTATAFPPGKPPLSAEIVVVSHRQEPLFLETMLGRVARQQ